MGSNSKICFLYVLHPVAPALVYCILLILALKMKYSFHLGVFVVVVLLGFVVFCLFVSVTLITLVMFVYSACKLLINLSL